MVPGTGTMHHRVTSRRLLEGLEHALPTSVPAYGKRTTDISPWVLEPATAHGASDGLGGPLQRRMFRQILNRRWMAGKKNSFRGRTPYRGLVATMKFGGFW